MKKALVRHQAHMETRGVMRAVRGEVRPVPAKEPPRLHTFVIVYDPKRRLKPKSVFHVHAASCVRLDHERRRMQRWDGDSWMVEATTVQLAIRDQITEFDEDDMGYEADDFFVHECELEER